MLHIENEKVKSLLLNGWFGLEKESLRITEDGRLSHTLHPFSDYHIVYDFCENQTEINTSVASSPKEAIELLENHTRYIVKTLGQLEQPELLWPFSNPPYIQNEYDIPIARHIETAGYQQGYREYLADRYGRYKMAFSGIHVNFSFSNELLEEDFKLSEYKDFQEYKDKIYLTLAERLMAYGWIITAITAASPLLDGSFIEKGKSGQTFFNGMASTRCSELGYWNYFTPIFDYSNIRTYADSIQKYVDIGLIAAPTELYYPIRLKPKGKNNLKRLYDEGVQHIEIRVVDLNPLEFSGVNLLDIQFIHLLIVWLICSDISSLDQKDQVQAAQNYKNAAHYDLKTVKIEIPNQGTYTIVDAGIKMIEEMKTFYEHFDSSIMKILEFEASKFTNQENRYAYQIRHQFEGDFTKKGVELAKKRLKEVL